MVVHRKAARLDDKNIGAANVFENLKINLAVAEAAQLGFTQRDLQVLADAFREREVRRARENFKAVVVQERLLQVHQKKGETIKLRAWRLTPLDALASMLGRIKLAPTTAWIVVTRRRCGSEGLRT